LIHSTLLDLLSEHSDADPGYVSAMRRIIQEAGRSEQAGFCLSVFPLIMDSLLEGGDHTEQDDTGLLVATAWRALHIAAKLLDDVEDDDLPRPAEAKDASAERSASRIINLATGFIALSGVALDRLPAGVGQRIGHEFHRSILLISGGQHSDLLLSAGDDVDLEAYFNIMGAKTGQFFALAGRASALSHRSDKDVVEGMARLGYLVGLAIQILDDLLDWSDGSSEGDLARGRLTLPLSYALTVAPPLHKARLRDLLRGAQEAYHIEDVGNSDKGNKEESVERMQGAGDVYTHKESLTAIYELVDAMGAGLYMRTELRFHQAEALLLATRYASAQPSLRMFERWLTTLLRGADPDASVASASNGSPIGGSSLV
jgi:geranylgeranyl pyrophosphate synthase